MYIIQCENYFREKFTHLVFVVRVLGIEVQINPQFPNYIIVCLLTLINCTQYISSCDITVQLCPNMALYLFQILLVCNAKYTGLILTWVRNIVGHVQYICSLFLTYYIIDNIVCLQTLCDHSSHSWGRRQVYVSQKKCLIRQQISQEKWV